MKGELMLVNKQLGFFVKRIDIQTKANKRAIREFIGCYIYIFLKT